jgi:hypothetical protein
MHERTESDEEYDYRKLLRRREWRERRKEILAKSARCVRCGRRGGRLAVHHPTYEYGRNPWEYPDEAYEVVCSGRCHWEADEDREEQERDAKNFRRYGWQWELGKTHERPNRRESEKLAIHEVEFRTWLLRKGILHEQWNWDVYPLWFLWNEFSKQFFAERKDDDPQGRLAL